MDRWACRGNCRLDDYLDVFTFTDSRLWVKRHDWLGTWLKQSRVGKWLRPCSASSIHRKGKYYQLLRWRRGKTKKAHRMMSTCSLITSYVFHYLGDCKSFEAMMEDICRRHNCPGASLNKVCNRGRLWRFVCFTGYFWTFAATSRDQPTFSTTFCCLQRIADKRLKRQ